MVRAIVTLVAACAAALALLLGAGPAGAAVTWCGTDTVAVDRPDATPALAWHVIYALPLGGSDRFDQAANGIATDLEAIDVWWRLQDPTRTLRFDTAVFGECASPFGLVDISRVELPRPAEAYQAGATAFDTLVADLNGLGFTSADKKYLVYYDGPIDDAKRCGQSNVGLRDGGPDAFAAVFLSSCSHAVGTPDGGASITAAHEMIHALNALAFPRPAPGPPNECTDASQGGHVCDSEIDILYPVGKETDTLSTRLLDSGRDDYYDHPGAWWDARDSRYLVHLDLPDATPPAGPDRLNVTSVANVVEVSWSKALDENAVRYRVYRDGVLMLPLVAKRSRRLVAAPGETLRIGVRAVDAAGLLGPVLEARFRVGYGIVDEAGALLRDTVPPPAPRLRSVATGPKGLVLRWRAVSDTAGPLRGYLVERNGKPFRRLADTTLFVVPGQARGRWVVRAIDAAGNRSPRVQAIRVR